MFFLTTKVTKKRLAAVILGIAVIIGAIVILFSGGDDAAATARVRDNAERVEFLRSLGWQVDSEPLEEQEVIIPKDFTDVYTVYNELQKSQGFDLKEYAGVEATRYTYKILNHPTGDDTVVADMIVYKDRVIAGDVQSVAKEGFMEGLKFPE